MVNQSRPHLLRDLTANDSHRTYVTVVSRDCAKARPGISGKAQVSAAEAAGVQDAVAEIARQDT